MDAYRELRETVEKIKLLDGHAHNIVAIDSFFPFIKCFTEADGHDALSFAPHTLSFKLRLAIGTRMVAHFNYHHTINDIRAIIDASRPGGSRTYQLQTVGFPPKPLTDNNQAGLANSVVVQKL